MMRSLFIFLEGPRIKTLFHIVMMLQLHTLENVLKSFAMPMVAFDLRFNVT